MNTRQDPDRHLPLPPHMFQILLSLLDRERHGYAIIKDVETRTAGEMVLGTSTVYAAIKRMHRDGLVQQAEAPPGEDSDGPKRRYYGITGFGRRVARLEGLRIARLNRMVAETSLLAAGEGALSEEQGQ